jgi:hypothetical protein
MTVIFHTKLSGFLSDSGTYTSDWREAKHFTEEEAFALCRRAILPNEEFVFLPIPHRDLMRVVEK